MKERLVLGPNENGDNNVLLRGFYIPTFTKEGEKPAVQGRIVTRTADPDGITYTEYLIMNNGNVMQTDRRYPPALTIIPEGVKLNQLGDPIAVTEPVLAFVGAKFIPDPVSRQPALQCQRPDDIGSGQILEPAFQTA